MDRLFQIGCKIAALEISLLFWKFIFYLIIF